MTKGLDQYLQDTQQLHASEASYFDDTVRSTNTLLMLEEEELVDKIYQNNLFQVKQEFIDEKESVTNILESQKKDTGYPSQWQAASNSVSHQGINLDANLQDDQ